MNRNVVKMLSETQDVARSENHARRRKERKRTARYDMRGRKIRTRFKKTVRIAAVCALIFAGLCILIYLPPVFGHSTKKALEGFVTAEASALRTSNEQKTLPFEPSVQVEMFVGRFWLTMNRIFWRRGICENNVINDRIAAIYKRKNLWKK